jgi:hypothetical protein
MSTVRKPATAGKEFFGVSGIFTRKFPGMAALKGGSIGVK